MQRILSLPLTGRDRTEGVSRVALGPLKDLEDGRRQVRALCYFPGLLAQPWHPPAQFSWLGHLQASRDAVKSELQAHLRAGGVGEEAWGGNDCEDFDQHGWLQIPLQSYGRNHAAASSFPKTMGLLAEAPVGPREISIVRQRPGSGLPLHSDQRNYMLTAHVVLNSQVEGCELTCDGETRRWIQGGDPTVIDTTFWHSTKNDSPGPVDVLLVDFWHPDLTPAEQKAMEAFVRLDAGGVEAPSPRAVPVPGDL